MAFHNWLLIYHGNGGRENRMRSRFHDSPCVTSRSHLKLEEWHARCVVRGLGELVLLHRRSV